MQTDDLISASATLSRRVERLRFGPPVSHVYNPLDYARTMWNAYLRRYAAIGKEVVLLGMNPGPWGMAQTGVPFGEVAAVRGWLGLEAPIGRPAVEHPKRPILGLDCGRSEVSGRRLWSLMESRFGSADRFFRTHFVSNYCPLVFMASSGRNITPDKLPAAERTPLFDACDEFLRVTVRLLRPRFVVGIGGFATARARSALADLRDAPGIGTVLHPSPASPAANRDWAGTATRQLIDLGVWRV